VRSVTLMEVSSTRSPRLGDEALGADALGRITSGSVELARFANSCPDLLQGRVKSIS
jgi:hypothetical protein